jgi:hypothetical protein
MRVLDESARRALRRAIWHVRVVVGLSLICAGVFGLYSHFGAWTMLISPASIIVGGQIMPVRELLTIARGNRDDRDG